MEDHDVGVHPVGSALRRLTVLDTKEIVDPLELAQIQSLSRLPEFTTIATRVTWIGLGVLAFVWGWFGALHLGFHG